MGHENKITKKRFIRAYDDILAMRDLNNAEKLVLIVICRYWPSAYWDTNEKIADFLGFSVRYVEKLIKSLKQKRKIKTGYTHRTVNGKPKTIRVIVPQCLPGRCKLDVKWIKPEQMDGQATEHLDVKNPNNRSFSPEQMDDLLETDYKKNIKQMPTPLPAFGQATAFLNKSTGVLPTHQELEKRRQKQICAVMRNK